MTITTYDTLKTYVDDDRHADFKKLCLERAEDFVPKFIDLTAKTGMSVDVKDLAMCYIWAVECVVTEKGTLLDKLCSDCDDIEWDELSEALVIAQFMEILGALTEFKEVPSGRLETTKSVDTGLAASIADYVLAARAKVPAVKAKAAKMVTKKPSWSEGFAASLVAPPIVSAGVDKRCLFDKGPLDIILKGKDTLLTFKFK